MYMKIMLYKGYADVSLRFHDLQMWGGGLMSCFILKRVACKALR